MHETIPCALCGSAQALPATRSKNWDPQDRTDVWYQIVKCEACGLQFLNPRPSTEHLASFYPDDYYAYVEVEPIPLGRYQAFWLRVGRWSKLGLRRAFLRYPPAGGWVSRWALRLCLWPLWLRAVWLGKDLKIVPYHGRGRLLEVGCGKGAWLDYQRAYGFVVTGVEPSRSAVEVAHRRYHLDVRQGTLEGARFPDRTFDVIHLSHVFEHLPDPAAALDEMHRVLDVDGLVILKLPNVASASARRFGPYWLGLDLPRHLYHFTPGTITALLHRHGFVVRAIRQDIGSWGFWRESRRIQARAERREPPGEARWFDGIDQLAERLACWRGDGSNMVVYAQKSPDHSGGGGGTPLL
jgi:SAM-dependent methyltransferase